MILQNSAVDGQAVENVDPVETVKVEEAKHVKPGESEPEIKSDIVRLDKKIDDRIDEVLIAVGDTTESRFEVIEQDVSDLQTRVTTLETAK